MAAEEKGQSATNLAEIRKQLKDAVSEADKERLQSKIDNAPYRNHGVLSKAEVALASAGWGPRAQADIEVFVLIDTEGLTPLLEVLNEMRTETGKPASDTPASANTT